ncbi:hypothetical protein [Paenibacillus sp. 481]|uniref:hypothetical protein n=1 Tax=Paenibacillus sp. 481 TaxID=2835869 RepID=UPI001E55664C|nr:hypothetical protein [Paenibacillus sp. 481]UHA74720.1 hypothetical protein KIK04_06515 [Paenibacillus sp. 481]
MVNKSPEGQPFSYRDLNEQRSRGTSGEVYAGPSAASSSSSLQQADVEFAADDFGGTTTAKQTGDSDFAEGASETNRLLSNYYGMHD